MANQDPNNLVLNQILEELQKLNTYEQQAARVAQSLTQVNTANSQTPVSAGLVRQAGAGQAPGALSGNASTPALLDEDALDQFTRQQLNKSADQQTGGQTPAPDEAVAWSLLSEAGHGGLLGNVRQAQYAVGRNLGVISGLGTAAGGLGNQPGWQDRLQVAAANQAVTSGGPNLGTTALNAASTALQPLVTAGGAAQNLVSNHELATTLASMSVAKGRDAANNWYEMAASMGFDPTSYGILGGAGQSLTNAGVTRAGGQVSQLVQQLRVGGGQFGGSAGARLGQGLTGADAQALVGELFNQGYTPTGSGAVVGGNMGEIASGLAPAVHAMGQQGAEIATSWTQSLRSANDSLSDLTQMLEQMPAAAKTSQLGIQGLNQALQTVAQTITSMGGTQTEGLRMGLQFGQLNPGVNPQNAAALASSPLVQGFGLGAGVLPSGLGAMPGGQFGQVSQQAVLMAVNALQGVGGQQQYMTLPDGTRVPLNSPQAAVFQQAASQFFPGMTPQDLKKIYDQAQHPQRSGAIEQIQNVMGQNNMGFRTGIESIENGNVGVGDWGKLSAAQRQQAQAAWTKGIAPNLQAAGLSSGDISSLNQISNVSQRINALNKILNTGTGDTGANQAGNAATVQINIGFTGKAAQFFTASASSNNAKQVAKMWQNAGGTTLNVPLNSAIGQNPIYNGSNSLLGSGDPTFMGSGNSNFLNTGQ